MREEIIARRTGPPKSWKDSIRKWVGTKARDVRRLTTAAILNPNRAPTNDFEVPKTGKFNAFTEYMRTQGAKGERMQIMFETLSPRQKQVIVDSVEKTGNGKGWSDQESAKWAYHNIKKKGGMVEFAQRLESRVQVNNAGVS